MKKSTSSAKKAKVKNVTPMTYEGILYKSTLEAYCAKALTEAGLPVNYEAWEVVLHEKLTSTVESWEPRVRTNKAAGIKVRTFAPVSQNLRKQVYTPDFACLPQGWVIETKGLRTEAFNARWRSFKQWLATNNVHVTLYMPGNQGEVDQCIAHILANNK